MTNWFVISEPQQLEVLALPGREEILDTIAQIGPCSISELAKVIGRSRNALYYPVKSLLDCGLLLESVRSGGGVKATAIYDVPARPMAVDFRVDTDERRASVNRLAEARLRQAMRGFERASCSGEVRVEGSSRNLWATHVKVWLSESELKEVNRLLTRLIDLVGKPAPRKGKRAYEFTFALYPTDRP